MNSKVISLIFCLCSLHVCCCFPLSGGRLDFPDPLNSIPSYLLFLVSGAFLILLIYAMIGCVCCPNKSIKALSYQNGMPINGLNENNSSFENQTEFAIFPPHSAVIDMQPVGLPVFEDKITFEPLPDILPRKISNQLGTASSRPAHFKSFLKNAVSLHDWFDDPNCNFPRDQLQYINELGVGWFGRVVEGEASHILNEEDKTKTIVKILREEASPTEHLNFLYEALPYRDLYHPNLVRLLGRCLESDPFLLIMEHNLGDLKSFLLGYDQKEHLMKNGILLRMAYNVASGLRYLHKCGFTHVDLAAHNCFISADMTAKIGDYGISFNLHRDDYYCIGGITLPIRWYSPETLVCTESIIETKPISKEANVWAFGIVVWEIFEFGKLPYEKLSNEEVLQKVLIEKSVQLPPISGNCSQKSELYLIMKECWKDVSCRPTMQKVEKFLCQLYNDRHNQRMLESFEERWNSLPPKSSDSNHSTVSYRYSNDLNYSSEGDTFSSFENSFDLLNHNKNNCRLSPGLNVLNGSTDELTENDACISLGGLSDKEDDSEIPLPNLYLADPITVGAETSLNQSTGTYEHSSSTNIYNVRPEDNYADTNDGSEDENSKVVIIEAPKAFSDFGNKNEIIDYNVNVPFIIVHEEPSNEATDDAQIIDNQVTNVAPPRPFHFVFKDHDEAKCNSLNNQNFDDETNCNSLNSPNFSNEANCNSFNSLNFSNEANCNSLNNPNFSDEANCNSLNNPNFDDETNSNSLYNPDFSEEANCHTLSNLDVSDDEANFDMLGNLNFCEEANSNLLNNPELVDEANCFSLSNTDFDALKNEQPSDKSFNEQSPDEPFNEQSPDEPFNEQPPDEPFNEQQSGKPLTCPKTRTDEISMNAERMSGECGNVFDDSLVQNEKILNECAAPSFNHPDLRPTHDDQTSDETSSSSGPLQLNKCDIFNTTESTIRFPPDNYEDVFNDNSFQHGTVIKEPSLENPNFVVLKRSDDPLTTTNESNTSEFLPVECDSVLRVLNEEDNETTRFCSETSGGASVESISYTSHSIDEEDFKTTHSTFDIDDNSPVNLQIKSLSEVIEKATTVDKNCALPILVTKCPSDVSSGNNAKKSLVDEATIPDSRNSFDFEEIKRNSEDLMAGDLDTSLNTSYSVEDIKFSSSESTPFSMSENLSNAGAESNIPLSRNPFGQYISSKQDEIEESSAELEDQESRMQSAGNCRNPKQNSSFLTNSALSKHVGDGVFSGKAELRLKPYEGEMVVEDLETGEQTIITETYSACDDFENSAESDEILKINIETDEAIIVDSSEALVGFVPSRSIELLQECEIIPVLEVPYSENEMPPEMNGISESHENQHFRNFCLQNEVIEEEITEEITTPSSVCSTASFSSNEVYTEGEEKMSQGSESYHQMEETSILPVMEQFYSESDEGSKTDISNSCSDEALDTRHYLTDLENNRLPDYQDVMHSWQPLQAIRWNSDETIDLEENICNPVIKLEGQEILAGCMAVKDITTALSQMKKEDCLNLKILEGVSPYSSVESSPCRDSVYTPDFESESDDTGGRSSTSCSSTSGSFECIHNKFKNTMDVSAIIDETETSPFSKQEPDATQIFSKTWSCTATPTKSVLVSPEKKFSSMRKSVSFHEEDPQVVFEYPPATYSSEEEEEEKGSMHGRVLGWDIDFNKYAGISTNALIIAI
nr:uncharacterized protein LOC107449992 isoform X2 [Parasteatoda tepidariorum]